MSKENLKRITDEELQNVSGGGCPKYSTGGQLITATNNSCPGYEYGYTTTREKKDSGKCKSCNFFTYKAFGFGHCSLRTKDNDPYK